MVTVAVVVVAVYIYVCKYRIILVVAVANFVLRRVCSLLILCHSLTSSLAFCNSLSLPLVLSFFLYLMLAFFRSPLSNMYVCVCECFANAIRHGPKTKLSTDKENRSEMNVYVEKNNSKQPITMATTTTVAATTTTVAASAVIQQNTGIYIRIYSMISQSTFSFCSRSIHLHTSIRCAFLPKSSTSHEN